MIRKLIVAAALAALVPAAASATPAQRGVKAAPGQPQPSPDEMFDKVDANRDGKVTRQEMQIFGIENRLGNLVNTRVWRRVDKDRNGSISRAEFTDFINKLRAAKR